MSVGSNMHAVGHHLQKEAIAAGAGDKDAFARSAFNRYYYSAFLNIRKMLGSLDPKWSLTRHSKFPEVLNKVGKKLSQERPRACKHKDWILVNRINNAKRAAAELATTMTTAYAIRVVADYEPEEQVDFKRSTRFALRSVDISDAHDWENRTRMLCSTVKRVWDEIYG